MHLRQWKFVRVVMEASLKCMVNFRYIFEKKRSVFISTVQEVQLFFSILAIFGYLRQNIFLNPFKAGAQQLGWESCQISWPYLHVEQSYGGKHGPKRPKMGVFGGFFWYIFFGPKISAFFYLRGYWDVSQSQLQSFTSTLSARYKLQYCMWLK